MSQLLKLDTLVTVLACLTTTNDELKPITKNSLEIWDVHNNTNGAGCPVSALGGLTARIQYLVSEVNLLKDEINSVQEQILDLQRGRSNVAIGVRSADIDVPYFTGSAMTPPVALLPKEPRNCRGQKEGVVLIRPTIEMEKFYVLCDQKTHDGGWIVIANRFDGSEDFNRDWQTYKTGFGSLTGDFFIGLDKLHLLTNSDYYELLILMMNKHNEERFARYDSFGIGGENEKYLLYLLGTFSGNVGDALRYHSGKKFTTHDQDNDDNAQNCARLHAGAWWYGRECFESNLFGTFQGKFANEIGNYKGILWKSFVDGPNGSLRRVKMLLRPKVTPGATGT